MFFTCFFFSFLIYFYAMCFNARCLSNSHVPIARARHDEINIRQSLTSTHKAAWRSSGNPRLTCGAALKYSLQKWKFEARKKNQFACSSPLGRSFRLFWLKDKLTLPSYLGILTALVIILYSVRVNSQSVRILISYPYFIPQTVLHT